MTIGWKWMAVVAGLALAALPLVTKAQEEGGTKTARELRSDYDKSLKGKTIAYLPIALGVPLTNGAASCRRKPNGAA